MFIPSHLLLSRHYIFYFRWPIPATLHPRRKRSYIKVSLNTREPKEALRLSRHLAYHAEQINWSVAIGMDYIEIQRHLKAYFLTRLAKRKELIDKNGALTQEGVDAIQNTHDFLEHAITTGGDDFIPYESIDEDLEIFLRVRKLDIAKNSKAYLTSS